jgi:hypothetical protein
VCCTGFEVLRIERPEGMRMAKTAAWE